MMINHKEWWLDFQEYSYKGLVFLISGCAFAFFVGAGTFEMCLVQNPKNTHWFTDSHSSMSSAILRHAGDES